MNNNIEKYGLSMAAYSDSTEHNNRQFTIFCIYTEQP